MDQRLIDVLIQQNDATLDADTASMNNPNFSQIGVYSGMYILIDDVFCVFWRKCVEVEKTINRNDFWCSTVTVHKWLSLVWQFHLERKNQR